MSSNYTNFTWMTSKQSKRKTKGSFVEEVLQLQQIIRQI